MKFEDQLEEMETDLKNLFGDDLDLRDETFLKQLAVVLSVKYAELWDIQEANYNNFAITQATNITLDYAVKFQGLRRKQATKSTGVVTFTGDENVNIPLGFIVLAGDVEFQTTESGIISGGSVDLDCEALVAGVDGNVGAGTIDETEQPLAGLTSVTNSSEFTGGLEIETDDSLRTRFISSLARGGGSTSNAIRAAILTLESVLDVKLDVNEEDTIVGGVDPHSFIAYVKGGSDLDIQTAIYEVKTTGIQAQGTLTNTFADDSGNSIVIGFERPPETDIWINATVTPGTNYPVDGDTQVNDLIVEFVNGLDIGEDLILFSLLTYIANNVEGIDNLVLESSTDGVTFNSSDITISEYNVANTDDTKVVVS
jgi:uncharacterized phage protein gp47/JayE